MQKTKKIKTSVVSCRLDSEKKKKLIEASKDLNIKVNDLLCNLIDNGLEQLDKSRSEII
jgi:transcription initiation factor TFIID subunit TAF12